MSQNLCYSESNHKENNLRNKQIKDSNKKVTIRIVSKIIPVSAIVISSIVLSGCSGTQSIIDGSSFTSYEVSDSTIVSVSESETQETTEISITETIETELIIPDEYYEIIDAIVDYIDDNDTDKDSDFDGIHDFLHLDNPKDLIAFAFVDIDGDYVAELTILDCGYEDDRLRIVELYTYFEGEVKHVASGETRCRYYLSKEMIIYCEGSSGAAYIIVSRYSFDSQLDHIEFVDSYYTIPSDEYFEGGFLCYTTDYSYILSSDFDSSCVELIDTFEFPSNIYEEYGIQEADLYDYGDITTLTEYCKG